MIFSKLQTRLQRIASRKGIIILFLLAHSVLLFMMAFTFPRINAKMGTQAFDLKAFGYSYEEAVTMIGNLDPATLDLYVFPQLLLLDAFYPLLLALFLSTLMIRLSKLTRKQPDSLFSNLYLLPFLAMLFDYAENTSILTMILDPINLSPGLVQLASTLSILKSSFTTLSWIVILILFVQWLQIKWKDKNEKNT